MKFIEFGKNDKDFHNIKSIIDRNLKEKSLQYLEKGKHQTVNKITDSSDHKDSHPK